MTAASRVPYFVGQGWLHQSGGNINQHVRPQGQQRSFFDREIGVLVSLTSASLISSVSSPISWSGRRIVEAREESVIPRLVR